MFSARLPRGLAPNPIARAVDARRARGQALLDLTVSNPTEIGIPYPPDVLRALSGSRATRYRPDPRGLLEAREAVATTYPLVPAPDPERIVLTASTSEAYSVLFKLLCDPGTEVLVPQPSYPLFDLLTRLDGVASRPYRMRHDGAWSIDRAGLEAAIGRETRAVLIVSPNNPTGSLLRAADREWLVDLCAEHGLAMICDEVFADYPLAAPPDAASLAGESRVLTFVMGGLSKSAGLPQVKLAWMLASGPEAHVEAALMRLDVINDTYLSASTPVQVAAASLIEAGRPVREAIRGRLAGNLQRLRAAAARVPPVTLLEPEAGWSAVVRVPATRSEEALVLDVLDRTGVLVHPGYFFDFPHEAFLVLSLLPEPHVFDEGVERLLPIAAGDQP